MKRMKKTMLKVAHLTSVHPRYDTRIFLKECTSLTKNYKTVLVVADGKGNNIKNDVSVYDVGKFKSRRNRIIKAPRAVLKKALEIDADLYHLHDPELIPMGLKLKKLGKKVIFDAHEDLPNQIQSKHYLNTFSKKTLSTAVKIYERFACSRLDGIVAATPHIRDKFLKINHNTIDINNYPRIEEFAISESTLIVTNQVCYIGGLASVRGIKEMVNALELTKNQVTLKIAGNFADKNLEEKVIEMFGWQSVDFLGYIDREGINHALNSSIAGLVVLHPTISYIDSLPVKMFEYMCAGIPVIASDFPLWRSIIDDAQCGLCVDPLEPQEIADAIDYLVTHPDEAIAMGKKGRQAITEKYNWADEEAKLLSFYSKILES